MTKELEELSIVRILNYQFKGYAEDAELILAYCLKFSANDIRKCTADAYAAIERMRVKLWLNITEANAGRYFYKLTDIGKRQLVM